jgi:hypothetical protein
MPKLLQRGRLFDESVVVVLGSVESGAVRSSRESLPRIDTGSGHGFPASGSTCLDGRNYRAEPITFDISVTCKNCWEYASLLAWCASKAL